jgi:ribosomal protein S4
MMCMHGRESAELCPHCLGINTMPSVDVTLDIVDALEDLRLVDSKTDARRVIATGGVYVNDLRVDGPAYQVRVGDVVRVGVTRQETYLGPIVHHQSHPRHAGERGRRG